MVAVNSSWVGLQMETGSDADCPISSFIMMFSTCVYLSHLPLNKLIIKKPPSEQQNNLNYDHQYQEMRQLEHQENILQLTPAHTCLDK